MAKCLLIRPLKINFEKKYLMIKSKTIMLLTAMMSITIASAQKAKVVSAYNYNKAYERDKDCKDLEKGIESIEEAIKDEKTRDWAKTWYYGGNLYFNAALTQDKECAAKFDNALNKTYDFYLKALKFNIEDDEIKALDLEKDEDLVKLIQAIYKKDTDFDDPTYVRDIMGQKFPYIANGFINSGVEQFQNQNYKKAKDLSEKSVIVNQFMGRFDTLGIFNAALAAERLEEYDEALQLYKALTMVNYGGAEIYLYMASIYDRKGDTTKKMEVIAKGREAYPKNPTLITEELNYLIATNQTDKALSNFGDAIEADPNNPSLYYNRGIIYDGLKETEKAAADYRKAMEVDPEFFDAAYNLGAMYYNLGVEWNNKASSYGLNEKTKYKEATEKANKYFTQAKPALEKAHEINPDDKATMASLVKIYAIQGEDAKYTSMKKKLNGK